MSSDPKNYFGFLVDEISERGHTMVYLDHDRQSVNTDTERCDAIHELGKFVLCKTEIIFRIARHFQKKHQIFSTGFKFSRNSQSEYLLFGLRHFKKTWHDSPS